MLIALLPSALDEAEQELSLRNVGSCRLYTLSPHPCKEFIEEYVELRLLASEGWLDILVCGTDLRWSEKTSL